MANPTFVEHATLLLRSLKFLVNGLFLENKPAELGCLNNLEVVLIAKRHLFKKIVISTFCLL